MPTVMIVEVNYMVTKLPAKVIACLNNHTVYRWKASGPCVAYYNLVRTTQFKLNWGRNHYF
jgi:hypothetical protein